MSPRDGPAGQRLRARPGVCGTLARALPVCPSTVACTLLTCTHCRLCPLRSVGTHGFLLTVCVSLEDVFDLSVFTIGFAPPGC